MVVEQLYSRKHGVFKSHFKNSEGNSDIGYDTDKAGRRDAKGSQSQKENYCMIPLVLGF